MSSERNPKTNPSTAERVGGSVKKPEQPRGDEPDFKTLFHAWLDSHRASLVDSVVRLIKQPIGSFFTCLVLAVALSLPMGLALLLDNVERLGGSWQRAAQISLFMDLEVDSVAGERLRDEVAAMPDVAAADWVSREQALDEFQQLSGLGEALKELPENPLPGVIIVTPEEVDKDKLEALRQQLAELPGVQLAQLDLLWVERLTAILKLGDRFVFGLTLLLVATLLLVIGNTIRLHIENRRTEIEVVKLVGGTDAFGRRPFLYIGVLYGLLSGVLAWILLALGLAWLNVTVERVASLYQSEFALFGMPFTDGLALVFGSMVLGLAGAWLAVGQHVRAIEPQ